jgi:hypothetical protein
MKKGILALVVLAFAFAVAAPAFAEDASQESKPSTKPPQKTELIRLKYFESGLMFGLVQTYLSRDGRVTNGPGGKLLVVSDYPENIDRVLQAIRQIDVKPADLQFTVQLILGSEAEEKGGEPAPNDPVIRELRNLLKYKSYSLLDTSLIRAMDNSDTEVRMGEKAEFEFYIRPKVVKDEKSSLIQLFVRLRQIRIAGMPPNATSSKVEYITTDLIGTTLNLKPGDKTVVGVSKLDGGDKGLILIISGKIVE